MNARYFMKVAALISTLLSGCALTPISHKVEVPTPAQWQNSPVGDTMSDRAYVARWWKKFQDPLLDELILRALGANHDLEIAAARVREARALVTVAQSVLFPTIDANVNGGRQKRIERVIPIPGPQGVDLVVSVAAQGIYALGAGLTAPIFNAGRIRANITASDARLAQVAASYEQAFLTSLEEVENAYVAYTSARQRREDLRQAVDAARRAYRVAEAFYRRGVTDFLSVLDAQRAKLSAEDEQAKAETAVTVAMVTLYRAFGGGWDSHEPQGISSMPQLDGNPPRRAP